MPFYNYKCNSCHKDLTKKTTIKDRDEIVNCGCGGFFERMISTLDSFEVTELSDKYRNKSIKKNITEILKKRTRDYSKKNIGAMIEDKGIEDVSKTSMMKNGKVKTVWDEK